MCALNAVVCPFPLSKLSFQDSSPSQPGTIPSSHIFIKFSSLIYYCRQPNMVSSVPRVFFPVFWWTDSFWPWEKHSFFITWKNVSKQDTRRSYLLRKSKGFDTRDSFYCFVQGWKGSPQFCMEDQSQVTSLLVAWPTISLFLKLALLAEVPGKSCMKFEDHFTLALDPALLQVKSLEVVLLTSMWAGHFSPNSPQVKDF